MDPYNNNPYDDLAVLIIDMQSDFVRKLDRTVRKKLVRSQKRVLELCAQLDIQVWKIELSPKRFGRTVKAIRDSLCGIPRDWYYEKTSTSAFGNCREGVLLERLQVRNIKKLFLMGLNADACVFLTADDAAHLGFQVASHGSVINSINGSDHQANLQRLENHKCAIVAFEEFVQL